MKINNIMKTILFLSFIFYQHLTGTIAILGELTYEQITSPDEVYEGEIVLINQGDEEGEVSIYLTDYQYLADGKIEYGDPEKNPRSNAQWIQFNPHQVSIVPGERATINYIVAVPSDTTLIGTYWCMMMVEEVPNVEPIDLKEGEFGVQTITRYGIQLISHIGNTGKKAINFLNPKIEKEDTLKYFQIDIQNIGEKRLRITSWIDAYTLSGEHAGKFEINPFSLYPGTSIRRKYPIDKLVNGTYKILVIADGGEDALFGGQYTIKVETESE